MASSSHAFETGFFQDVFSIDTTGEASLCVVDHISLPKAQFRPRRKSKFYLTTRAISCLVLL